MKKQRIANCRERYDRTLIYALRDQLKRFLDAASIEDLQLMGEIMTTHESAFRGGHVSGSLPLLGAVETVCSGRLVDVVPRELAAAE